MSSDHQGQVETILSELGKKIDELVIEAKGAKDDIKEEVEDKIKDLKGQKEKLEDEFSDFKQKNEGKWEDIKTHLSSAADEIKKAAEAAFKKNT